MPRGSLGHSAHWSLVGYVEDAQDGGFPIDFDEVALVVMACRSDPESRQRMVATLVGPADGCELVETIGCMACGDRIRVPTPPWLAAMTN